MNRQPWPTTLEHLHEPVFSTAQGVIHCQQNCTVQTPFLSDDNPDCTAGGIEWLRLRLGPRHIVPVTVMVSFSGENGSLSRLSSAKTEIRNAYSRH